MPYTEELAYRDWAPYTYLDGFFEDPNTRGDNNRRAYLVETDQSTALEVLLPEGCVTGECAMQAKNALLLPVESATLKFKCASLLATSVLVPFKDAPPPCTILVPIIAA